MHEGRERSTVSRRYSQSSRRQSTAERDTARTFNHNGIPTTRNHNGINIISHPVDHKLLSAIQQALITPTLGIPTVEPLTMRLQINNFYSNRRLIKDLVIFQLVTAKVCQSLPLALQFYTLTIIIFISKTLTCAPNYKKKSSFSA